ncbi:MAG: metalloenzyme domain-containing protein [Sandaracinus sp.]|nr:metalloenzyme domain-containing protein [Sandaracinus sp.]MAR57314.1 metalloenzyme domain-containing protein [Rickettsiales bacterium]
MSAPERVGRADIALVTLDTLRFDVAAEEMAAGRTPAFAGLFPGGWEERHTPSSFTLGAHLSFLAGFLPTPARPGPHPRPFAARFAGSESTGPDTFVFDERDLPRGLAARGYRTLCVGGVGFFDPATTLGAQLTEGFEEVRFEPAFRVTEPDGLARQLDAIAAHGEGLRPDERRFTLLNVSSLHQPNRHYLEGATRDDRATHAAALRYVDGLVERLVAALRRGPLWLIVCSDHGTAYGEAGYLGHRLGHPVVWTVPYAEAWIP